MSSQASSSDENPDFDALLDAASSRLQHGEIDRAANLFHQALKASKKRQHQGRAFNGLGLTAMATGQFGLATRQFGQALDADPVDTEARQNLVMAQISEGQRLANAGSLNPAWTVLKTALDEMNSAKALAEDRTCRDLLGSSFCNLGILYRQRQGDVLRALEAFREAWRLLPGNKFVWPHLDEALIYSGLPARLSDYTNEITEQALGNHLFIACFPKSGSTFLKNLLVEVTGFPEQQLTYSHGKNDTGIYLPALIDCAELDTVTQLHVRASDSNINQMQGFSIKPVILVRNIFDVLLSYKEHHDQFARQMSFYDRYDSLDEAQRLDLIVDDRAAWYLGFFAGWQRAVRSGRIEGLWLSYEELMADKVGKTKQILRFYGLERPRQAIADAIENVSRNKFANRFNKGVSGRGSARFDDRHRAQIRRIAGYHPDIDFSLIGL